MLESGAHLVPHRLIKLAATADSLNNGLIHTRKASRAALADRPWLTVELLPRYAPELNNIERNWRDLKRHHLTHCTFKDTADLTAAIHVAVRQPNKKRQMPHSCNGLDKAA